MLAQQSEINHPFPYINNSETAIYHLNKLFKTLINYHQRNFINCFKWHVLQSLIKNMSNQKSKAESGNKIWLYQSLVQKKNKSQQEIIEFQFINMCASKIQCAFKSYVHKKRHRKAINKLNQFKNAAKALLAGWKVRQIFRSVKIQESIRTIRVQRQQLLRECKVVQQTNNRYSMRKLEYLKNSLQDQVRKFSSKFQYLYATGEWVFEPKVEKKRQIHNLSQWIKKQEKRNQNELLQENIDRDEQRPQQIVVQQITKKKRVRQMRDRNTRPKKEQKQQQENANQIKPVSYGNQFIQRPIKAKGVYKFDQLPNDPINEPQEQNKNQVLVYKKIDNDQKNQEQNNVELQSKKNAQREKNKYKMQTRQKYDPRKAIQEEKKRKKQQEQKHMKGSQAILEQKQNSKINATLNQHDLSKSIQKVLESKSQKLIKNVEKEQASNRNTVNLGKGKNKVQAKIDCWGNRKTNRTNTNRNQNNRMTYKMIHQPHQVEQEQQQSDLKQIESKGISLLNRIKEQRLIQKEQKIQRGSKQQNYIQKIQQQLSNSQNWVKNKSYEKININEVNVGQVKKLSTPLRQKLKKAEQMKQREIHKQIEQLEKVYTEQYQSRFQKLLPKLHLLAAARQQESEGPIPVLMNNGSFMRKKIAQNLANNKFWIIGKKIQNTFKQFDRTI